jgi:signal transduction histidine kinase
MRETLLGAIVGAAIGAVLVWLTLRPRLAQAAAAAETMAALLSTFSHDVRGALSAGVLMAERLQHNPDPAVREAAAILMSSMDRAAEAARVAGQRGK